MGRTILREPTFCYVQARENFDARDQGLRQNLSRCRYHLQQTINSHSQNHAGTKWLDMNVGCAQFDRLFQKIVDGANDRRATGEIPKTVDVIVSLDLGCLHTLRHAWSVLAKPLADSAVVMSSKDATARLTGPPRANPPHEWLLRRWDRQRPRYFRCLPRSGTGRPSSHSGSDEKMVQLAMRQRAVGGGQSAAA